MNAAVAQVEGKTQRRCNYCGKPFEGRIGDLERSCTGHRGD